jgi:hypothetical protein
MHLASYASTPDERKCAFFVIETHHSNVLKKICPQVQTGAIHFVDGIQQMDQRHVISSTIVHDIVRDSVNALQGHGQLCEIHSLPHASLLLVPIAHSHGNLNFCGGSGHTVGCVEGSLQHSWEPAAMLLNF